MDKITILKIIGVSMIAIGLFIKNPASGLAFIGGYLISWGM